MPLVRISLVKGKPEAHRRKVGDAVHLATRCIWGIARSSDLVIIQITLSSGRTLEQKRALYRRIADNLGSAVGLRPEDVWINLVEVAKGNWSFGNGVASYATEGLRMPASPLGASMFKEGLLKGKRILITGGGTGLGREIAAKYVELGAELWICGRRGGVLQETAKSLGGKVRTHPVDIRDAAAVDAMVQHIWDESGPLTGLVNNAAGNFISPTKDLTPNGFNAIANIVFHGTFYVTQAVGKRWIAGGHKGSVISILVTWVHTGSPYVVPSAMSKAGLHVMTKSLAVEWGKYGIRLNGIAPGPFPTEGATKRLRPGSKGDFGDATALNPMRRVGEMQELQNLAAFLMADGCEWLTGETIAIDGAGYLATGAAGYYVELDKLTDADWERMRAMIKATNEKDRAARTT